MICSRCGAELPGDARFCPSCGSPVGNASVAEERKFVSVLFVDVVGSTARADGADPEDVRDRNQLYYQEVRDRIERHGGTVEKYVGDAVMAVFGAPLARSDDAERAVRASLSILEGIAALNERDPRLDLQVRAAVCTGEAIVSVDASPADALATGDVINTAARLQSAAPVGRAVVGAETYRLTRHAFGYRELDAVDAKGKRDPVQAWLVERSLGSPAERPTSATPIVGREREVLLIRTVWDRAVTAGSPHLVTVIGPAGIGKSRLAQEVAAEIEDRGERTLWGRSLPYEEHTPYRAFGQILRRAAGIYENDSVEVARQKLGMLVGSLFAEREAADATRYLSLMLGLGVGEPASESIHLLFAARRVVELLSEQGPLLLVFEDVHWADDSLLDLLDYLISRIRDHPVAFLALARPEFLEVRPTWGAGVLGQTMLQLEPLTTVEATQVVGTLLAGADPSTVTKVVEKAEGNPLFIEELVAALGDEATVGDLPATVRAAIAARIDALPPDARTALLHASVIGQSFWSGVLQGIGELDDVDASLEALEARGLVRRHSQSQVEGDVEFAFKHVLIRDVAYATLPRGLRRDLHAATARLVEASVPDPTELAWVLAHHWREGGEPARAIGYLLAAGDRARAALAVEETYDFYTRALELADTDVDRRRIRLRRGLALAEHEQFSRADDELGALIPELDGRDEINAILARARSTFWTEQAEETLALAQRAADLASASGAKELEGPAIGVLGATYAMRGEEGDLDRAIELQDRALAMWVPGTRQLELAEQYHMHADNFYWTGDYPRALELSRLAATTGGIDPLSAEYVLRGAGLEGLILAGMGRYEEALAIAEAAIETARRLGRGDNVVMNYSTMTLRDIFRIDEALERSSLVAERLGPSDFNMPWMNARADVISAELLLGHVGNVERSWSSVWDDAVASRGWERWLITGRLASARADMELERGLVDDAVTWARRALEMARTTRRRKYEIASLITLGSALAAQGLSEDAADELRTAVRLADGPGGSPLLRWRARAALGTAALQRAETALEGEAELQAAGSIIHEVAAALAPERADRYVAAPQVARVLEAGQSAR
jgi:class 3 adenylate cyclase/tetratricopeptide (TPR) repeat protein